MLSVESWEFFQDLLVLDPTSKTGGDLTAMVRGTAARQRHGFTSVDGMLYVHGGGVLEVGGVCAYDNRVNMHVL